MKFEFRKKLRNGKTFKNPILTLKAISLDRAKAKFLKSSALSKVNTKLHVLEITIKP